MKASFVVQNINTCIKLYGDRDLHFTSVRGNEYFQEEVTTVQVTTNDAKEPIRLCGNSGIALIYGKFIELNWFGRLIKKWVVKK